MCVACRHKFLTGTLILRRIYFPSLDTNISCQDSNILFTFVHWHSGSMRYSAEYTDFPNPVSRLHDRGKSINTALGQDHNGRCCSSLVNVSSFPYSFQIGLKRTYLPYQWLYTMYLNGKDSPKLIWIEATGLRVCLATSHLIGWVSSAPFRWGQFLRKDSAMSRQDSLQLGDGGLGPGEEKSRQHLISSTLGIS